ncbi:hypothetical protein [Lacrimispora sp. JR3]|uniref:hypothetical protein n=1 Tax=Lacrimispora sinapis TaxID=3111456 RepID=UPI003748E5D7
MERKWFLLFPLGCALVLSSCGQKNYIKAGSADAVSTQSQASTIVIRDYSEKTTSQSGITASIKTHKDKNISIQYPVLSHLNDEKKEEEINTLLKNNALKVLQANSVDPLKDTLIIEARIVSADSKRITAVYTGTYYSEGAAHPLNMFYTNTVDLTQGKDLGLTDYANPETLAEYVLSDQVKFYNASAELTEALLEMRTQTDLDSYTKIFQEADFPLKLSQPDGTPAFPDSFSYEEKGAIIFSIPVPHALGDYALVSYTPVTK